MGKGDIKTYRGKLFNGSYGNKRPRRANKAKKDKLLLQNRLLAEKVKNQKKVNLT